MVDCPGQTNGDPCLGPPLVKRLQIRAAYPWLMQA